MLSSIAVLLFTVPVEDILIPQMGDEDYSKREAATMLLSNTLKNTDGWWHYETLQAVERASRGDKNPEIRLRARMVYENNHLRYYQDYPEIIIRVDGKALGLSDDAEGFRKLDKILKDFTGKEVNPPTQGASENGWIWSITIPTPADITHAKLKKFKSKPGIIALVFRDARTFKPWKE
jgi:hypothetical protein